MSKRLDLSGKTFGDVEVIRFYGGENTHALWLCLCHRCNETFVATAINLKSGNTTACNTCRIKALKAKRMFNSEQDKELYYQNKILGVSQRTLAQEYETCGSVVNRAIKRHEQTLKMENN